MTFVCHAGALACLNGESRELKDGTFLFEDPQGLVPYGHHFNSTEEFELGVIQLDSLYNETKDLDYLSDKGLLLILLGQYHEAIKLYLTIEQLQPNRYSTASNIGTAYELIGENEKALQWIKKSIDIDPSSHYGSEWIHAKILEAKIKGKKFYNSNFILGTDFGTDKSPKSTLEITKLKKLSSELYYQLNERVSFVKPKDEIVAMLLFELGNVAFLTDNFSDAIEDYNEAKRYGFTESLLDDRIDQATTLSKMPEGVRVLTMNTHQSGPTVSRYWITVLSVLFLLIISVVLVRRRNEF